MKIALRVDQHDYDLLLCCLDLAGAAEGTSPELLEEIQRLTGDLVEQGLPERRETLHKKPCNSAGVAGL